MRRSREIKKLTSVPQCHISKAKGVIKNKLPILNSNDIRRYKIPYYKAIVHELHEQGFRDAAEYFELLFDLDEEIRIAAGPDTLVWNKPRLRDDRELIDYLKRVLCRVSQISTSAKIRTTEVVEAIVFFQNKSWEWWWIAESLYKTAFWISKELEHSNKEIIAILKYLYAKFLFYQMKSPKAAFFYLREAEQESRGMPWKISKFINVGQENLSIECHKLLHRVLLNMADETRSSDVEIAVNYCKFALNSAVESGHKSLIAEAHMELGKSEAVAGNINEALENFEKSRKVLEDISDPEGLCTLYKEFSIAYKKINDNEKVLEFYQKLKDTALKHQLLGKLAEGYYLTGDYYLIMNNPTEATPNLENAFSIYKQLNNKEEANRARCLVGVSKGQEMMDTHWSTVIRCINGDVDAMQSICRVMDRGEFCDRTMHKECTF